jgi:hypothetical protein
MKYRAVPLLEHSGMALFRRTAAVAAVAALFSLSVAAGAALACDHEDHHEGCRRDCGDCESTIYGLVEKLPQGLVGVWVVNNREIRVTRDTHIEDHHGAAEVGAYVEVEGNITGRSFTAYEIEVKRSKRSDH